MDKKVVLKKYTGKGGPIDFMKKVGSGVSSVVGNVYNKVKSGIAKYKNFVAEDKELNQAAAKIQGPKSSNQYNIDEFRNIKNKLKRQKQQNAATSTISR